jgi:hypothetical protein
VTSQVSALTRLRHALDRGSTVEAMAAAGELEHVGLVEALELVLLLARGDDERRFRAACVRWHARYCQQARVLDPAEGQAVLGLLVMLRGERRRQAATALAHLLDRRDLARAGEALLRDAGT